MFSAKQKVPPIYKALATHFRNRVRFGFTNPESAVSADLSREFSTEKWPTLLISTGGEDGSPLLYEGKMKLHELIEFVEPHALTLEQAKDERVISSKEQTTVNQQSDASGYSLLTSVSDIDDKIIDE